MRPILKILIALSLILIHPVLSSSDINSEEDASVRLISGKEISALVNTDGGIYLKKGDAAGFHFELLNRFAQHYDCNVKVAPVHDQDYWKELIDGKTDLLVIDTRKDTIPSEYSDQVITGFHLQDKNQLWIVTEENYDILRSMNRWFGYFSQTRDYERLDYKYYSRYRRVSYPNGQVYVLSPYDHIIKEYARNIGWDWRLLASLVYQESKFSISARSYRNAHGLMQLLPSTAASFGIENLFDPEENIKAGTMFLKRLSTLYDNPEIDSLNRIKLILASYNAGEGRVRDIRNVAEYKKVSSHNWDSLKTVIPYMNHKDSLPEGLLRHGSFKGTETMNYVDEIINRYENYKVLVKK
jgi:membrane-bound lytic murein transglycosylase F